MHVLLQFSFNRFEIIQGSFIGYDLYGLCFFLTIGLFLNFWRIFILNNDVIILTLKCTCVSRFEIIQTSFVEYEYYGLSIFDN